jgi:WD40 repeat protein
MSASAATTDDVARPFVGLAPFTESDALYFFGRGADRAMIASNLVAARLTVLYGPSGCGKSSLLDAGVAHEINRERAPRQIAARGVPEFVTVTFRSWRDDPKLGLLARVRETVESVLGHPVEQLPDAHQPLAEALGEWAGRLGGTLLVVLDQFEEYFLYHGRRIVEGTFAWELARAVCHPHLKANILISLREDSLAQLDVFEGHITGLLANTLRLDRLDRERGRETIAGPIERYNTRHANGGRTIGIEPRLIDAVLETVQAGAITLETAGGGTVEDRDEHADGNCPIETAYLQLVMTRLWEAEAAAGSRVLRLETFERLGGAKQIVGTHLDTVMATFEGQGCEVAADLFRYLVTPTGTKIALTLNDLAEYTGLPPETIKPVLIQLGSQQVRILREVSAPNDDPAKSRYEIFHDVLAAVILDWRRRYMTDRAAHEAARIAEARRQEDARIAEAGRREEARAAEARRRKLLLRAASVVVLFTTVLSAFAITQWVRSMRQSRIAQEARIRAEKARRGAEAQRMIAEQESIRAETQTKLAEDEKNRADSEARISQSSVLAAQAASVLDSDPEQGLALALAAARKEKTAAAERALRLSLSACHVRTLLRTHRDRVVSVAYSPDGNLLASASRDGHADVWDAGTGEPKDHVAFGGRSLVLLSFSGAGRFLSTVDKDGVVTVHDLGSKARPSKHGDPNRKLWAASFTRDGSHVAVATDDRVIRVWELPSGRELPKRPVPDAHIITRLAFSSGGETLAAIAVPDSESGAAPGADPAGSAGARASSASHPSKVLVWKVDSSKPALLVEEPQIFTALALGADGKRLVTGARSGQLKAWDLTSDPVVPSWTVNQYVEVADAAFNPAETLLATAGGNSAQLWEVSSGRGRGAMYSQAPLARVTFSPDGERVFLRSDNKTAQVWAVGTQEAVFLRGHTGTVLDGTFSRDGRTLATASDDGTARIWDVSPERQPVVLSGPLAPWSDPVFSRDGLRVVTACVDNSVRVWRATDGKQELALPARFGPVASAAISADGQMIATAGTDRIARVWSASSGELLQELRGHTAPLTVVAFNPAKGQLATASHDGTARLWDLGSGQILHVLSGHEAPVTGLAFRQNGSRLATAGLDNTIRVWDTATGKEASKPRPGYSSSITGAIFSPDGRLITASMGIDKPRGAGTARIIDVATRQTVPLHGHDGSVAAAAFSPDGRTVATAGYDRTVRLWNAATGQAGSVLYGHNSRVSNVIFSPKGSYLASEAGDTTAIVWNARNALELFRLPGLTTQFSVLAFNPKETLLATVDERFNAHLWNLDSGKVVRTLSGHTGFVRQAAFSPDGLLLATASQDGTARLWDTETGKTRRTFTTPISIFNGTPTVEFSRDGRRLITFGTDTTIRVWDLGGRATEPLEIAVGVAASALGQSHDDTRLAIGCTDGTVRLVDQNGKEKLSSERTWASTSWYLPIFSPDAKCLVIPRRVGVAELVNTDDGSLIRSLPGHPGPVVAAKFTHDGRRLATSSTGGALRIWDMQSNDPPLVIDTKKPIGFELLAFDPKGNHLAAGSASNNVAWTWDCMTGAQTAELAHPVGLAGLAFSPDGKHLATSSHDNRVRIWDAETGKAGPVLLHEAVVNRLSFSPDSTRLATAGMAMSGRVWDVKSGKPVELRLQTTGVVRSLKFSPDGKRLVSAGDEQTLRIWDAETGRPVAQLRGLQLSVYHVAFSPDSKHLVAGGNDLFAQVWEVETGKPLASLQHGTPIFSAAYSTDGTRIVTTSGNNSARVWDATTGKVLSTRGTRGGAAVKSLAFSHDDRSIISTYADGDIKVWDVETGKVRSELGSRDTQVNAATLSPDAARVVIATGPTSLTVTGQEPKAQIWKETESEPAFVLRDGVPAVVEAWFSRDGVHAITLRRDGTAKVWDATTGSSLSELGYATFYPATGSRPDAAISPNGKFMAITSFDGVVRVFDLMTGKPLTVLTGPGGYALSVAFGPDSRTVLVLYANGTARLFVIDTLASFDELYTRAEKLVRSLKRELNAEDLQKYLAEPLVK